MKEVKRNIASFVYCRLLRAAAQGALTEKFWQYLRAKILKFWDPIILLNFGNVQMNLHFSHNLPLYYCKYKLYDRLLPELCLYLETNDENLKLIDVGANVGDTAALVDAVCSGKILCIEGDKEFFSLLELNIKKFKNSEISVAKFFCSNGAIENEKYMVDSSCGTAHLTLVENAEENISLKSLDDILDEHTEFKDANILKIDTDGFEPRVLQGGENFLTTAHPLVFFEFTPQGSPAALVSLSPEEDSFKILSRLGYERALFYDNFGNLCKEVDTSDNPSIKDLISKIDLKEIFYYDVLCCHKENEMHNFLLDKLQHKKIVL